MAGCATSPTEPPPNWSAANEVHTAQNLPPFKIIPPVVISNLPPVVHTNPPPVTNIFKPPVAPVFTWTSLNRWTAEAKIGLPRLLTKSPLTTYAINSGKGRMVLAIGSREATWNGATLHLGFAPEIIDGEVFVHGLDLQKNLEPLLCEPPTVFGTNRVIVIDPGHGGVNGGTISVLDKPAGKGVHARLGAADQALLETNGWQVFLTRTNDADIALSNRVTLAESHHADLFISLHFNSAAPDKKQNGLETYCLTPTGMPSTLTRGFADLLFENLPNNNFDAQNLQLAVLLHKTILHASGEEDRGVRRARFIGVLRGQKRPAILIEGGFLSNPREAERIANPEFRQKLAEAVANALMQSSEPRIQKPEQVTPQTATNSIPK